MTERKRTKSTFRERRSIHKNYINQGFALDVKWLAEILDCAINVAYLDGPSMRTTRALMEHCGKQHIKRVAISENDEKTHKAQQQANCWNATLRHGNVFDHMSQDYKAACVPHALFLDLTINCLANLPFDPLNDWASAVGNEGVLYITFASRGDDYDTLQTGVESILNKWDLFCHERYPYSDGGQTMVTFVFRGGDPGGAELRPKRLGEKEGNDYWVEWYGFDTWSLESENSDAVRIARENMSSKKRSSKKRSPKETAADDAVMMDTS
jgi:hypothetical protein